MSIGERKSATGELHEFLYKREKTDKTPEVTHSSQLPSPRWKVIEMSIQTARNKQWVFTTYLKVSIKNSFKMNRIKMAIKYNLHKQFIDKLGRKNITTWKIKADEFKYA